VVDERREVRVERRDLFPFASLRLGLPVSVVQRHLPADHVVEKIGEEVENQPGLPQPLAESGGSAAFDRPVVVPEALRLLDVPTTA
jgi:hypothetical protein